MNDGKKLGSLLLVDGKVWRRHHITINERRSRTMRDQDGVQPDKKQKHVAFLGRIRQLERVAAGLGRLISDIKGEESDKTDPEAKEGIQSLSYFLDHAQADVAEVTSRMEEDLKELNELLF